MVLSETLINVKTQFTLAKTDLFTERRQLLSALCSSGYSSPWHLVTYLAHWCARTCTPPGSTRRVEPAGGSCGFAAVWITLLTTFAVSWVPSEPPCTAAFDLLKHRPNMGRERDTLVLVLHSWFCTQCPERQEGIRELRISF